MKTHLLSFGTILPSLNIGCAQTASPQDAFTLPLVEDSENISNNLYFPPDGWTKYELTGVQLKFLSAFGRA